MAIASLVLGILGLIPIPIPFIGTVSSLVGLILGVVAKKKLTTAGSPSGIATAGIVLCIISLAISVMWTILCGTCAACAACATCIGVGLLS